MDLRPPRSHILQHLWYDSRNATILPIRVLVHTGAAWVQEAARFRSRDGIGRGFQLESWSANGNPFYSQQVSMS